MAALSPRDVVPEHWKDRHLVRKHADDEKSSWALYSPCENYRYRLRRVWSGAPSRVAFLMLNPSTASEIANDPTVERCERRARAMGFGGFEVINIFALRTTDPKGLYGNRDPNGVENDRAITEAINTVDMVIAAWGNHGVLDGRSAVVRPMIANAPQLSHLGLTKINEPKHPLYLSYKVQPQRWSI